MNQKIDTPEPMNRKEPLGFSPDFIFMLVILTGATLLLSFFFEYFIPDRTSDRIFGVTTTPWNVASSLTIKNSVKEFSGHPLELVPFSQRLYLLISILLFIIAPTLFFLGWKKRHEEKTTEKNNNVLRAYTILSIIGGSFVLALAIVSFFKMYLEIKIDNGLRASTAIQNNKDNIIDDFNAIAWQIHQYKALPHELGGGHGSFIGYILPVKLSETENGTYTTSVMDSTVILSGQSKIYSDASVKVRIDSHGKMSDWQYLGKFKE
jgi:hypothetical protein